MAYKTLYVGNLSYSATEQDLRDLFAQFNPGEIRLIGSKGFGFVDVPSEKVAEAVSATNMKEVRGRAIRVDEARPRPEKTGGGQGRHRA
ncbi:MAG: RNA-binding protein [Acidobacteriota bacterium]